MVTVNRKLRNKKFNFNRKARKQKFNSFRNWEKNIIVSTSKF